MKNYTLEPHELGCVCRAQSRTLKYQDKTCKVTGGIAGVEL
jgi:hypothetical protein